MSENNTTQHKKGDSAGLFIPAGLFLGFAYGFLSNDLLVGIFGGLGVGFLLFALTKVFRN